MSLPQVRLPKLGGAADPRPGGSKNAPYSYVVLTFFAIVATLPILVMFFSALKSTAELATNPIGPPLDPQWGNFAAAWEKGNVGQGLLNTGVVVFFTILATWLCASLAAYSMARLDLPFKSGLQTYLFVVISLPVQSFIVPLFFLWVKLGLVDSLLGLIIIYTALNTPFAVLLLRTFLINIPRELDEAARIDGANEFQVATRVILPLTWPGLLTVGLVVGLAAFGELQFAVTFLISPELLPISTSFLNFSQGNTQLFNLINAASVIITVPLIALFLLMQRQFISGLASSGTKG
ncbi:carbohydrate ABC transporter permease [Clavibacter michiganensis subsp. phaseoli]|uniref:Carbohydrate ABC transporter permease n=1 Tax=Clavibacter phaseoli TaxID=1734031 RepID=A0A8I0VIQ7_9MICO|nr:carbohydrate ABC transporter permease [Clavibacter phaseoli]MBF4632719.1 carbohydrate ABC transporter permease [Clavibacter phaseoli]